MKKKRRKNRKRTNKNIPAKGVMAGYAHRLWSYAVRDDWDWECAVCGLDKCEAHHLIPCQHEATRYDLRNGIALCASHHKFDADISPHQNAVGWVNWLGFKYPETFQWYLDTVRSSQYKKFKGIKNNTYYINVIQVFREYVPDEKYVEIIGVKFADWLEENE